MQSEAEALTVHSGCTGEKRKQNENKAGLDLKVDFLFLAHLKALTVAPGYNNANRYSCLINTDDWQKGCQGFFALFWGILGSKFSVGLNVLAYL